MSDPNVPGGVRSGWPRLGYGFWPELERIEVTDRAAHTYDEASSLEHRIAKANGESYGCPPRHWSWEQESRRIRSEHSGESTVQS